MKPVVLFRRALAEDNEFEICGKYFDIVESRMLCRDNLVIGRYATLPYYSEIAHDLQFQNSLLINDPRQHRWIANFEYYSVLKDYTPETWFDHDFCNCTYDGPFVVKGKTNSRKNAWNRLMFAKTKRDALNIGADLLQDSLIGEQGIIYRKYVPLITFEIGIGGVPITNEWRFFFFKNRLLSYGYYWSIADELPQTAAFAAIDFAEKIAKVVANYVNFFVLDVAETQEGNWILIEINDGQQSGLSENDPDILYYELYKALLQHN